MYEAYFGLSAPPFQLNPDPAFYFNSRGHGHALAYLRYGVVQGEGFIVVTGEIGAGKTTLVRTLLTELDRQQVVAAQIVSTQLEAGDLLQAIITAFGIPAQGASKAYMIATLEAFLTTLAAQGRRALLIVDEAQNLNAGAVEELRMLSNFQLGNHSLLQSFLIGQPELRRILELPTMEQFRQRISASCHLGPLDVDETRAYVEHRLRHVGWPGQPGFEPGAFAELHRWSGGVPRRLNRLANRVMLATFLDGRGSVDGALVERTARELRGEIGEVGAEPPPVVLQAPTASAPAPTAPTPSVSSAAPAMPAPVAPPAAPAAEPVLGPAAAGLTDPVVDPLGDPLGNLQAAPIDASDAATELPQAEAVPVDEAGPDLAAFEPASADEPLATDPAPATTADLAPDLAPAEDELAAALAAVAALDLDTPAEAPALPVAEVERLSNIHGRPRRPYLLALADSPQAALELAALARALAARPEGPLLLLVTPGQAAEVWPWDSMERLLPRAPLALHLGVPAGRIDLVGPPLFDRLDRVLAEFSPLAALVAGQGDALLAAALVLRKRGLPVAQLAEADMAQAGAEAQLNHGLIARLAVQRYVGHDATTDAADGAAEASTSALPGSLLADVCHALEAGVTTPTGACLRNNLSIYLGPDWSAEVQGTPYAAVALSLSVADPARTHRRLAQLLACDSGAKLLWLVDEATELALRAWHEQASADEAEQVFIIDATLGRDDPRYRRRLAAATVLSCRVTALPDQLSLLRGALAIVTEPGQLLGGIARLWQLPVALLQADGQWSAPGASAQEPDPPEATASSLHAADDLAGWLSERARAGYAARAAQAAIHAAAATAGSRSPAAAAGANSLAHLPGLPALPVLPVAAPALAQALIEWLHLQVVSPVAA